MKKHIAAFVLIGQEIAAAAIRAVWNRKRRASEPVSQIDVHNDCPHHLRACSTDGCDGTCEVDEEQEERGTCIYGTGDVACTFTEHWSRYTIDDYLDMEREDRETRTLLGPLAHFIYKDGEFTVGNGMTSQQRESLQEMLAEHGVPVKVEVATRSAPAYLPFTCPSCGVSYGVRIDVDHITCECGTVTATNNYRSRND